MNTDEHRLKLNAITEKIIGCAFQVSSTLGCGFLEKVHENALAIEMRKSNMEVLQQHNVQVHYGNNVVGEYTADLLVEQEILVELKATKALDEIHTAQCLNYLKANGFKTCLLLNFGRPKLEMKRIIND